MLKKFALVTTAMASMAMIAPAQATTVIVDARAHSSSGGTGQASGLSLTAGQGFTITSLTTDLWNAGPLPRWSDANGLVAPLIATGSDESGAAAGTLIGQNFGLWTQNGLSSPYGSLVGEIGGVYRFLGANFNGQAWASGNLNLYYWDSDFDNNTQSIAFDVSAVPEPATWMMMLMGFAMTGAALRRRKTKVNFSFA